MPKKEKDKQTWPLSGGTFFFLPRQRWSAECRQSVEVNPSQQSHCEVISHTTRLNQGFVRVSSFNKRSNDVFITRFVIWCLICHNQVCWCHNKLSQCFSQCWPVYVSSLPHGPVLFTLWVWKWSVYGFPHSTYTSELCAGGLILASKERKQVV